MVTRGVQIDCPLHLVSLEDDLVSFQQLLGINESQCVAFWFVDGFLPFGFLSNIVPGLRHTEVLLLSSVGLLVLHVSLVEAPLMLFQHGQGVY